MGLRGVCDVVWEMRTVLPVSEGSDGGESCSRRRIKVGRMKKLLGLKLTHSADAHADTVPGVCLRSFQLLGSDEQCEVSSK